MIAATWTGMETPMEIFPEARKPDLEVKLRGDWPSATPIPISSRTIGKLSFK